MIYKNRTREIQDVLEWSLIQDISSTKTSSIIIQTEI